MLLAQPVIRAQVDLEVPMYHKLLTLVSKADTRTKKPKYMDRLAENGKNLIRTM